jgi:hypothetical protein
MQIRTTGVRRMTERAARTHLLGCGLVVVSIGLGGLLAEAAFRLLKASFGSPPIYEYDENLGWAPIPNLSYEFIGQAENGEAYDAHYATDHFGFRLWGDPASDRPRIFFVGDSFTQDHNMSNQAAYYAQVARRLPVEVFAVGGGGYSTLQEVLMLEKHWHAVAPTHVVIQFCSNDFGDNHFESGSLSIVRNQTHFRPYLIDGEIVFRTAPWYRFFYRHSMLFRFLDQRVQNLQYAALGGYSDPGDAQRIRAFHDAAVEVTREILRKGRKLGSDAVKWYMFNCAAATAAWLDLARDEGFEPIVGVAEAVEAAEAEGMSVRASDGGHWNNLGHEIAGRVLAAYLEKELSEVESGSEHYSAQQAE